MTTYPALDPVVHIFTHQSQKTRRFETISSKKTFSRGSSSHFAKGRFEHQVTDLFRRLRETGEAYGTLCACRTPWV